MESPVARGKYNRLQAQLVGLFEKVPNRGGSGCTTVATVFNDIYILGEAVNAEFVFDECMMEQINLM